LLQERGNLPRYGSCWKNAVEHVEEGCRTLSEDTQSDIALHITNCFLEMSGHETYNCELDKKPNIRGSCIASMSDRAFNVYTEFYTHTQNICWFLRGQVWHETIAENTLRVGKQLESSAKNQEEILKSQKESLVLQGKLLKYGKNLEKIMEEFYISTQQHNEILLLMSKSLGNLQSWLIGELSWVDLIVFYISASILTCIFTSTSRTITARLPILLLLMGNAVIERLICTAFTSNTTETELLLIQNEIYKYIWWLRKLFIIVAVFILVYKACYYKDLLCINNALLQKIYDQNLNMLEILEKRFQNNNGILNSSNGNISFTVENDLVKKSPKHSLNHHNNGMFKINNYTEIKREEETCERTAITKGFVHSPYKSKDLNIFRNKLNVNNSKLETTKESVPFSKLISGRQRLTPFRDLQNSERYNLRSRQGTPDLNI
ncbi:hypothetical protein ILUMI_13544, partial [Ignelater luminosus]